MKKPNKKALCIFTAILTVALIGLTLYFLNASQNVRSRLTDSELKVIDHFSLFDYETLSKEILEEKQFLIDEKQDISIHNSAEYTYKSLADNGVDDSGIEYALIIISDKGKIEECKYWYSFADLNNKQLEQLVNVYCKAAGEKSFTDKANQKVTFKKILELSLPVSDESGQNASSVRYDLFQDNVTMVMHVYSTGEVELFTSFSM